MADTVTLGQVAVISRGAWSSGTAYNVLDMVSHNGGAFLCAVANSGVEPGVTSGWATSWVQATKGIKNIAVTSPSSGTVQMVITYSDGTSTTATYPATAIGAGGVTTDSLANLAVTTEKLAAKSVTTAKIADGAVGQNQLADNAVTQAKIAANAVGTNQLADGSVTGAKLSGVTYANIGLNANQVRAIKIGTAVPTTDTLADGEIYLQYS